MSIVRLLKVGFLFSLTALLWGCGGTIMGVPQGQVAMVDPGERLRLTDGLTMTDLMSAAEDLTNKMLGSYEIESWGDKRPRLIVGRFKNRTQEDLIPEEELDHKIRSIIVNSGVARIMGENSTQFDYVLTGRLSATKPQVSEGGQKFKPYRMTLDIYKVDGELYGSWTHQIQLLTGKKPIF